MKYATEVLKAPTYAYYAGGTNSFASTFGVSSDAPFTFVIVTDYFQGRVDFGLIRNQGDSVTTITLGVDRVYAIAVPPKIWGFFLSVNGAYCYVEGWSNG